ncbi:MAG: RusA family crossover junction endodeoxyribonuclease [Clostridium sp.]|nr:RusA family crossover junction endodeoxyribonuclease [Clostridium sp.]
MKFRIKCIPPKSTGQAGLRILKRKDGSQFVGKFSNSKPKQAQNDLMTLLMPYAPDRPLDGALEVKIVWTFPWRKSEPKKNRITGKKFCTVKPDLDNSTKIFQDILIRLGFWTDDAIISILHLEKYWGDEPGIDVEITQLTG